ncbi:hypothetical protein B9Z55_023713 [Caenorhabditis nigoni]|uniref:SET domain-containing protein n=1 Tax=Caenorhabditis nigoni TaxID=1611254 RepID=A0A2G5SRD2_9PELO|nr:hypothetical protein B9Z55_023713 [Caenorhabditis nigoni]
MSANHPNQQHVAFRQGSDLSLRAHGLQNTPPVQAISSLTSQPSTRQKRTLNDVTTTVAGVIWSLSDTIPSLRNIKTNLKDNVNIWKTNGTSIDPKKIPSAIVVQAVGSTLQLKSNNRIQVVQKYEARLASGCSEARRAQENGSWKQKKEELLIPGLPSKKFLESDDNPRNQSENIVQDVFLHSSKPGYFYVLWEGWAVDNLYELSDIEVQQSASEAVRLAQIRDAFLDAFNAANGTGELDEFVAREKYLDRNVRMDVNHPFWTFKDLTYFHTQLHADLEKGPVFYFSLETDMQNPPNFTYTNVNVVREDAYIRCLGRLANQNFSELSGSANTMRSSTACSSPQHCKCNQRALLAYGATAAGGPVRLLQYNAEGLLQLDNYNFDDARILVECSNTCQCSPENCHRRVVQRGKSVAIAVVNGNIGYGGYAAEPIKKGQYIVEYVGEMYLLKERRSKENVAQSKKMKAQPHANIDFRLTQTQKDEMPDVHALYINRPAKSKRGSSYEAGFSVIDERIVICASKVGNVGRFFNHSCNPNATFVEVHSRCFESDPLIPKIAIFALRDIAVGEAITLRYYSDQQMKDKRGMKCG